MLFPPSLPEVFSLSLGFGNLTTMCFHTALPVCISFNIISLQMDVLHEVCKIFIIISKLFSSTLFPFSIPSEEWNVHQNLTLFLRLCPFFRIPSCFISEINLFLSRDPESSSWILFLLLVFYNLNLVLNIPSTNSPFFFLLVWILRQGFSLQ